MRRAFWPMVSDRSAGRRWLVFGLLAALAAPGCGHEAKIDVTSVSKPPTVQVIQPAGPERSSGSSGSRASSRATSARRSIPKLTGYIEKWNVDIGDKVKKGDVLATLFVPELVEDFGTKKATVELDEERVELARKVVEVAEADVKAAEARLDEAKAILAKYEAEVDRWDSEVKRLEREVERGVVDPQILLESTNQWKSSTAARDAAKATIAKAEAELLSEQATLAKAKVDVAVARADLAVAESEAKRIEAWVGYLTLPAPFDGVIVARNANTGDFVLPATGDPTAMHALPRPVARRQRRADLRGRPHRHRPDLRRHPRAGRQLRPRSGPRRPCSPGRTATSRSRAPSRAPPGPSTSRAGRSAPRSTCPTPAASSCPGCTPTPR